MRDQENAKRRAQTQDEILDQELEDSFPASDPPQTTQPHMHLGGPYRSQESVKTRVALRHRKARRPKKR